jgi:hypothetical protein
MNDETTADLIRTAAKIAEAKWLKLYTESVDFGESYYDRDRRYAKMLSAREAYRLANKGEHALVTLADRAALAHMDWLDWPTAAKEGRQEGLRQILDAVESMERRGE